MMAFLRHFSFLTFLMKKLPPCSWKSDHIWLHSGQKTEILILPILWSLYCQFSPFDFDRPSWPQFCLELGKIFSGMLELEKILDLNLIWIIFVRYFFHSEPRKIGLKTKNVYFFTVAYFWRVFYKNNVKLWWIFKVIFYFSPS